ncbi:MAG TPA: methylmalonyl-CoA mutase family protein [Solirubrobacteraceae bacterium]
MKSRISVVFVIRASARGRETGAVDPEVRAVVPGCPTEFAGAAEPPPVAVEPAPPQPASANTSSASRSLGGELYLAGMAEGVTSAAQTGTPAPRTLSGEPVEALYTEHDLPAGIGGVGGIEDPLGRPGEYPFTRGVYESMYRGRLWTMRQFAGFGTSEETNERFHYLLEHGQTGLSTAFDMPSLMGHDSDHTRSLGEVGREGVAIDTLQDMRTLFGGIDLGAVSVSMTINAPAAIMLAFYVAAAESDPANPTPPEQLAGTIQADILKEYIAQKEWCFPIDPAMRLCGDMIEWCTLRMPRWHPISISGYHIREAGATADQELAFTLMDGLTYVRQAVERGLDVDDFAPRLSFFFNAQIDLFEEIAKYRAARRIWARELRETFGAKNERSWLMRFHAQTAGVSLTAQQPLNNIVRTTIEALAAVLGGTQSLHTNSYDEALALPTEAAVRVALRTQQVIAHETGVANTADPLGGSYFVEALTDRMERRCYEYFEKIDQLGGMVEAVKGNYPQREIADAAFELQQEIDSGERVVVGVNRFQLEDEESIPTLRVDPALERKQLDRLQSVRARRDGAAVERALAELREAAAHERRNLMDPLLECARANASEGEIVESLQQVFGDYTETPVF